MDKNTGSHALLVTSDFQIILQKRDNKPGIQNPGKIGIFGGRSEKGENERECLNRELLEELGIDLSSQKFKTIFYKKFIKTIANHGQDSEVSIFIVYPIGVDDIKLTEGLGLSVATIQNHLDSDLTTLCRELLGELSENKIKQLLSNI